MNKISLTDLVDIVSSSGVPKVTKVTNIKNRPEYEPQFDFYKPLREAIQTMHKKGRSKSTLDDIGKITLDAKKRENYRSAIKGYKKWLGKKSPAWLEPQRSELVDSGISVMVNPELHLDIDGMGYIIKLYFKSDKLTKSRVDIILCVLEDALRESVDPSTIMAVVDVRNAKMFTSSGSVDTKHRIAIGAELAYVSHLWGQV